ADLLRRAKPSGLFVVKETWPDENEEAEKSLRKALLKAGEASASEARAQAVQLETQHGMRRQWVWAKLGWSPLAKALTHLNALASRTAIGLGGDTTTAMAELYASTGYLADDAVMRALAAVKSAEDCAAVFGAARAMYLPWLQDSAEHFQKLTAASPLPSKGN